MEVTLEQMLAAREERAFRQFSLNRTWGLPMVSFSMNIPGPVKDSALIRRGFLWGVEALDGAIPGEKVRCREIFPAVTGWEAVYVVDMEADALKAITTKIEDERALGRLFDMDVLDGGLDKLDRETVGGGSRDCIVCGAPGRGCASRRVHSVGELQKAVRRILHDHFREEDAQALGAWAVESLLEEVETTPKPGLVDRRNCGSHRDMTVETFYASARALGPYFSRCARIGQETADLPPRETFRQLREAGLRAEGEMYAATGGVNTHKGAIFTMGILCGAAGRLWKPEGCWNEGEVFRVCAAMTAQAMEEDLGRVTGKTAGERLYLSRGIQGIRGEAALGFPSVEKLGLPAFRQGLERGMDANDAGVWALLSMIARVRDTCMIRRGGMEGAGAAMEKTAALLGSGWDPERVRELDDWFIARNLSPGGCADLLAAVYFIEKLS